jgi:hypothetical protein
MPGQNKSKSNQREAAIDRVAVLEQLIAQIDAAQKSASSSYHNSELASLSLSNADAAIAEAVKSLSLGHYERVDRLLHVTWFYAKFAQDIVGAEATEHLLGNDRFLDLIEPESKVQADLQELMGSVSAVLDRFNSLIPPQKEF